jgi:hypothetical protein
LSVQRAARILLYSLLQDIAGDALFFRTVNQYKYKAWVGSMFVPYSVLFAAACAASLAAGAVKFRLFVHKWRSRYPMGRKNRSLSIGGVQVRVCASSRVHVDHDVVMKMRPLCVARARGRA